MKYCNTTKKNFKKLKEINTKFIPRFPSSTQNKKMFYASPSMLQQCNSSALHTKHNFKIHESFKR